MSENETIDQLMLKIAKGETTWEQVASDRNIPESEFENWRQSQIELMEEHAKPKSPNKALGFVSTFLRATLAFFNPMLAIASIVFWFLSLLGIYEALTMKGHGGGGDPIGGLGEALVVLGFIALSMSASIVSGIFGIFSKRRKFAIAGLSLTLSTILIIAIIAYSKNP